MSATPSLSERLRTLRFLEDLSAADLDRVSALASVTSQPAGAVLFPEGAVCERLYVVLEGLVGLDMHVPRRGPVRLMTVGAGEILGWSALLSDGRMTARAVVLQPAELVEFPSADLRALCAADHDVGYVVMRQVAVSLSRRLLATRLQMLDVFEDTRPVHPVGQPFPRAGTTDTESTG